jgi:PII-like signaling protein
MREFDGEKVLMRIHISEQDKLDGKPLSERIVALLRERHLAGATVFRGAISFGAHSEIHSDRIEVLSLDLPLVVECVESEQNIRSVLPELDRMIGGGLITLERANVILYRAGPAEENTGNGS